MRRLLVNDTMSVGGEVTFWNLLEGWFYCEFIGGEYDFLNARVQEAVSHDPTPSLIIRNASYFPPLEASESIPTISLLQDIFLDGPMRKMQERVLDSSRITVVNSDFTASKYIGRNLPDPLDLSIRTIPLPVDFTLFRPGNAMGLQQALGLPDGCICWVGACREAGPVKGWDIFLKLARLNPDLHFVAVFKDAPPEAVPPNMRVFARIPQLDLVQVMGACRVGLCTSRMESQHLAGIEMGACGLPMIAPNLGCYWSMVDKDFPGTVYSEEVRDHQIGMLAHIIRSELKQYRDPESVRERWRHDFDRPVIRAQWEKLVAEVESR